MKIGIDCRLYSSKFTGIGRYTYELTKNLFKLDSKNHYVLFFNNPEYKEYIPPSHNVKKVLVNSPHYSFSEQIHFLKILLKEKLDLMHFTHFNAPILYFRPSIVTIHDLIHSFFPSRKHPSLFKKIAYYLTIKSVTSHAKQVIAVSENTKKDLQKVLHINPKKITVIYEGVNEEFEKVKNKEIIEITLKKYNITHPYILYTGVTRHHKNIVGLIKAFKILKDRYSLDCNLVITGKEDPFYPEVRRTAYRLELEKDIMFLGLVPEEDLIALYTSSRVYVLPSFYEGFGFTPLEAMKCGTPVAVSRASSLPEVCGKENAVYFDPYDIQDMAHAINKVFTDERLREKLIKNGLERVKIFSWEIVARHTLEVYNNILNK